MFFELRSSLYIKKKKINNTPKCIRARAQTSLSGKGINTKEKNQKEQNKKEKKNHHRHFIHLHPMLKNRASTPWPVRISITAIEMIATIATRPLIVSAFLLKPHPKKGERGGGSTRRSRS